MIPEDFAALDIGRYEMRLRALEPTDLPPFLGSTLRGAFGHSLKQAVCVMPHRNCERCLVADRCLYPYLFETPSPEDVPQLRGQQQAPHPFILSPPAPGAATVNRALPELSSKAGRSTVTVGSSVAADLILGASAGPSAVLASSASRRAGQPVPALLKTALHRSDGQGIAPAFDSSSFGDRLNLLAGDEIAFGLLLMGRAIEYLPYVVYAMKEMSRRGLGADRARFELTEVLLIEATGEKRRIFSGDANRITTPSGSASSLSTLIQARLDSLVLRTDDESHSLEAGLSSFTVPGGAASVYGGLADCVDSGSLKLRFVTPTRIRVDGDLQAGMSFELLVRNLLRRISMLCAVHGRAPLELDYRGLIDRAASVKTISSRLRWCDWERYSNRQQTKMRLGGFMGMTQYQGDAIGQFLPLLIAGEFSNIGAGTSFGLGSCQIVG